MFLHMLWAFNKNGGPCSLFAFFMCFQYSMQDILSFLNMLCVLRKNESVFNMFASFVCLRITDNILTVYESPCASWLVLVGEWVE